MNEGEPTAAGTRRKLGYQPALDGVRAFAVLTVILHHAFLYHDWPPGGGLGVTTFFVSSGFLITVLLLQEHDGRGRISLTRFYRRRGLRLLPALTVYLAAYLAWMVYVSASYTPSDWSFFREGLLGAIAGVFYFTNILLGYDIGFAVPIGIGHLWTLATQEQFYLLWPPLLALALRRRLPHRWLVAGLSLLVAVIVVNRLALALGGAPEARIKFAPDATFDAVLLGCIGGVLLVRDRIPRVLRNTRVLGPLGLLAAAAGIAMILAPVGQTILYGVFVPAYSLCALLVVLAAVTAPRSLVNRALSLRPMVFVGRISYSLFLWQQLSIFWLAGKLTLPGAIVFAFVAAYASHVLVEKRFLELKRRDRAQLEDLSVPLEASPPHEARATTLVPDAEPRPSN